MKIIIKISFAVLLLMFGSNLFAQTNGRDFTAIDAYVKSLGNLENILYRSSEYNLIYHFQ